MTERIQFGPQNRASQGSTDEYLRFALLACAQFLGGSTVDIQGLDAAAERSLVSALKQSKTSSLVLAVIENDKAPASEWLIEQLRAERGAILSANAASLAQAVHVSRLLQKESIETLIIKGPCRSSFVFGGMDWRRANDADVLVRKDDYEQAGKVLLQHGFRPGVSERSIWWHHYLGESPYLPNNGGATVDLHFRIQQPGAPAPISLDELFSTKTISPLCDLINVPSPSYALLISYIEMSKAIRSREAWIINAMEVMLAKKRMSLNEMSSFNEVIRSLELNRMISHLDKTISVFSESISAETLSLNQISSYSISEFFGVSTKDRLAHRSRLQFSWANGNGLVRLRNFAREMLFWYRSEIVRINKR